MPKKRQEFCPNCQGTNEKCKYLINGRKCAKGKAKGKAISDETIEKRERYDSLLGDFHTDYLNLMYNNSMKAERLNRETQSNYYYENIYSFERYLNLNGEKTLASWARKNLGNKLKSLNVKPPKVDTDRLQRIAYRKKYGKIDDALRVKLNKEEPLTEKEIQNFREKEEKAKMEIVRTQTKIEAIETAKQIEEKLKECDRNKLTDEQVLKEISDLANEIDLSYFERTK